MTDNEIAFLNQAAADYETAGQRLQILLRRTFPIDTVIRFKPRTHWRDYRVVSHGWPGSDVMRLRMRSLDTDGLVALHLGHHREFQVISRPPVLPELIVATDEGQFYRFCTIHGLDATDRKVALRITRPSDITPELASAWMMVLPGAGELMRVTISKFQTMRGEVRFHSEPRGIR